MKIRKFVAVAAAAAALVTTAACGSDDSSDAPPVSTNTTASSSAAVDSGDPLTNADKVPSVKALNDMLNTALDPKIKAAKKVDLVEDAQLDPKLFNELVKAVKDNPDVTYRIKAPVTKAGPKRARVKVVVKIPGQPANPIDASIVYDNGRWKLSKETVCPLLALGDVESPICGTDTPSSAKKSASKPSS